MTIAAFDHPLLSGLLGDDRMSALLGFDSELAAMLRFEAALAEAEAEHTVIPAAAASQIGNVCNTFRPHMSALREGLARDGVVVPALVAELRRAVGEPHAHWVHFGATSQDVIDTAFVLRALSCLSLLRERMSALGDAFNGMKAGFGSRRLMGRTRMQAAMPIRVADRVHAWSGPLPRNLERLDKALGDLRALQFGGAVGTLDVLGESAPAVRASLARRLGLDDAPQWHSQRDRVADLAGLLSQVTGSLGKFGQDVALMAQAGGEIELAGGGTSSAMAHKQNPVDAEMLVALARFNATLVSGVHHALVHEQERSGAAWTLEWMTAPQMLMAAGASTRLALRLAGNIRSIGTSG